MAYNLTEPRTSKVALRGLLEIGVFRDLLCIWFQKCQLERTRGTACSSVLISLSGLPGILSKSCEPPDLAEESKPSPAQKVKKESPGESPRVLADSPETSQNPEAPAILSGKSKWGLSNGGLRPLSAICAQLSTIVHFCGLFGPLFKGNFRHKMTTIVGNRGQL